jgi:hypothetical protein
LNLYTYYYANYRHGDLTEIPCNTCNFTNIITIDFSFNRISNIDDVSCLFGSSSTSFTTVNMIKNLILLMTIFVIT